MSVFKKTSRSRKPTKTLAWFKIALLIFGAAVPALSSGSTVSAAQLSSRSVAMSTSEAGATASHAFSFTTTTSSPLNSFQFEYCTSPLGTCVAPDGMDASAATVSTFSPGTAGTPTYASSTNTVQVPRSSLVATTVNSGTTINITLDDVVNPNNGLTNLNYSFYVRIVTYSAIDYTGEVDAGVVAGSTNNQLTVNARVQERLDFCVGSTTVDDDITSVGTDCSTVSGNTVDLGIVDASLVNTTPVDTTSGGNSTNGLAMIRTNAVNGAVISYFAEQDTNSGALKVAGATCSGTDTTDQCFNSQGTTQGTFTAGTEKFGMTVGGVNCGSTTGYTCTYATGDTNLKPTAAYKGDGAGAAYAYGVTNGFAWDDTGTASAIATSAGSPVKVLDDEALILRFAATASVTTPTGQYTVTSTYIATATF